MSEIPNQDPTFREPTVNEVEALDAVANEFFEGQLQIAEKSVKANLGFGYTVNIAQKEIMRFGGGELVPLIEEDYDGLVHIAEYGDEGSTATGKYAETIELLDNHDRLYVTVDLPDKSSIVVTSGLKPEHKITGMFYLAAGGGYYDNFDLMDEAGYDGFRINKDQLKHIGELVTIARTAIDQQEGAGQDAIDINRVKAITDHLIQTANVAAGVEDAADNDIPAMRAFHAEVLPLLADVETGAYFGDILYSESLPLLPADEVRVDLTAHVAPDGSTNKRLKLTSEVAQAISSSLENAILTIFEKTADDRTFCGKLSVMEQTKFTGETNVLNLTAQMLGTTLDEMLEDGVITAEEYAGHSIVASLKEAGERRKERAIANFEAEKKAGFHTASAQDVLNATDLLRIIHIIRHG